MKKPLVLSYPVRACEGSDQTGRMPRLIWVFAMHTLILLVLSCRDLDILPWQFVFLVFSLTVDRLKVYVKKCSFVLLFFDILIVLESCFGSDTVCTWTALWHPPLRTVPTPVEVPCSSFLIWAATWQNQQCGRAPSEDSDQPGIRPVWSESSLCA